VGVCDGAHRVIVMKVAVVAGTLRPDGWVSRRETGTPLSLASYHVLTLLRRGVSGRALAKSHGSTKGSKATWETVECRRPTDRLGLMFFHAYMYGPLQGKLRLYRARDVRSVGKALTSDWEVFASILVKDVGTKLSKGVDLSKYEVKSAENGGSVPVPQEHGQAKAGGRYLGRHLFFDNGSGRAFNKGARIVISAA
jgi:hypothetical protein